jgi:hypothetical protein
MRTLFFSIALSLIAVAGVGPNASSGGDQTGRRNRRARSRGQVDESGCRTKRYQCI